ncbi:MAG: ATP-dependent Clp protease ATP-binding subunit ClpA [Leptospirales bacterium]|nr:ATP-dependent Clp protease ATP-binding subunit ClpA [Leptospirales bacterium]
MDINENLNNVLMSAFNEAMTQGHEYLTPEHILYSSLKNSEGKQIIESAGGAPDELLKRLELYFAKNMPRIEEGEPLQTIGFRNVMERAIWHISNAQKNELEIGDVLASILEEEDSFASYFMKDNGITRYELLNVIAHDGNADVGIEELEEIEQAERQDSKILDAYTTELVERARRGELDPLIGREDILERTELVLCRRTKNNPIHVGEPGVGKTAITEGIAQLVAEDKVPAPLKDAKIYRLDMGAMIAGTRFRGDFEDRMKKVLAELEKTDRAILFIDEIHTVIGAGAVSGGSMDASNMLKPLLSNGRIKCIGSTTYEEYRKYFEKDRALSRRFQKIDVPEPSKEETLEILKGLQERYEDFHNVKYTDEALAATVELSAKYINDRHLPDKAIDVIDEAGASVRMKSASSDEVFTIDTHDVERIVAKIARIPEKTISASENSMLKDMASEIEKRIFGQSQAVNMVSSAIKRGRAGFGNPDRPVASFLFVGPTGVGKTELARQLAAYMGVTLHRFDMSEYQEKHTVARLVGAPPGYVGYEEGGLLTEAIQKTPHAVLLLDEIEKAHQDIFNTLLQVMDYATLTDNTGKKADFRNVVIIMTSNAGTREIGKQQMGFGERIINQDAITSAVDGFFTPEFRNRLDAIVTFGNLDKDIILQIVNKYINEFKVQLAEKNITLELTEECLNWLADKGYSPQFGAREIGRVIQDKIKSFFIDQVLFGELQHGGNTVADIFNDEVIVKIVQ